MRQGLGSDAKPFLIPSRKRRSLQPRLREAKLAQHRGRVPLLPAFGHPAVQNAIED